MASAVVDPGMLLGWATLREEVLLNFHSSAVTGIVQWQVDPHQYNDSKHCVWKWGENPSCNKEDFYIRLYLCLSYHVTEN